MRNILTDLCPQLVAAQIQRDVNILYLAQMIDDLFSFMKDAEPLRQLQSHERLMVRIAQQTTECGYFILAYCADGFSKYLSYGLLDS